MPESSPDDKTAENGGENDLDVKASAESSPAGEPEKSGEGETGDLVSAVKAALKPKEEAPASEGETDSDSDPEPSKETDAKEGEGDDDDEGDDDLTEEELSRLKPKTKKRIQTLLAERAERDQAIEDLSPKAERFDNMVNWLRERDLRTEDVNLLFDIGANLRQGNLRDAYDKIRPVFENLQQALGITLTDDLRQRVDQGQIDEDTARRLASAETERQLAERRAKQVETAAAERKQADEQAAHQTAVMTAVSTWETSKSTADPDWKLKQPIVMQAIELAIHRQGYPKTTDDAVKMAEAALKEVDKTFGQLAPRKREVKPPTDGASTRAPSAPKSLLEAAKAGLTAAAQASG